MPFLKWFLRVESGFFAHRLFLVGGQEAGVALVELEEEGDTLSVVFPGLFAAAEGVGGVDGGV